MQSRFMRILALAAAIVFWSGSCVAQAPQTAPSTRPAAAATQPASYPMVTLRQGDLELTVYLPDAKDGYYRGARFDWSGMVAQARYKGHTFFGPWRQPHNPLGDDHGAGPAEEFSMGQKDGVRPLHYDKAQVGEGFVKIGVGVLEKPVPKKPEGKNDYFFRTPYKLLDGGAWKVDRPSATSVVTVQELTGPAGYAYRYTKEVALTPSGDGFVISHTLVNTGREPIEFDHYSHNLFLIDGEPAGPSYTVSFPFEVKPPAKKVAVVVEGRQITFPEPLPKGRAVWIGMIAAADDATLKTAANNAATIVNTRTGASVRMQGDTAPAWYNFYAEAGAICPEPFVVLKAAPGQSVSWSTQYTFDVK